MTKKRTSGKDTKEGIIKAATNLFYLHGFCKASIRDIAAELGITQASIYNHFSSKDEILFTIINRTGSNLLAILEEINEKFSDPVECLKQMISQHLSLFNEQKKEFSIFVDELYQLPEHPKKLCNIKHRQIFDLYRDKLVAIEKKNMINPIDKTVASFSILGMIIWSYRWVSEKGPLKIEGIAEEIVNLLFNGLLRKT